MSKKTIFLIIAIPVSAVLLLFSFFNGFIIRQSYSELYEHSVLLHRIDTGIVRSVSNIQDTRNKMKDNNALWKEPLTADYQERAQGLVSEFEKNLEYWFESAELMIEFSFKIIDIGHITKEGLREDLQVVPSSIMTNLLLMSISLIIFFLIWIIYYAKF